MDNGVRDGISNWLVAHPTLMGSTPWLPRALYKSVKSQLNRESILQLQHARQPPYLCGLASVWENLLQEFPISYSHTEWHFIFSWNEMIF